MNTLLQEAQTRTFAALHQTERAHLQQQEDPAWPAHIPENERISHVVCRAPYMPALPWSVCLHCRWHAATIYDTVKRPIVKCRVLGKEQDARTLYITGGVP
jgi:hypothetical protein